MSERCDACGNTTLDRIYTASDTTRELSVYLCGRCALVQSLPRIDKVEGRTIAISGGADWGNIRYGKGFRTHRALEILQATGSLDCINNCLDVGASRGSFVTALQKLHPKVTLFAVEPDGHVVESYRDLSGLTLILSRIEDVELDHEEYDLIYCSHTLEHLRTPYATLCQLRAALKPDGVLFIEVPNLAFIANSDVIEEFFIDKHLYHFTLASLRSLVMRAGFAPVACGVQEDESNITMVLKKTMPVECQPVPNEVVRVKEMIAGYKMQLARNLAHLRNATTLLNALAIDKRLVVWGGGRIFDVLVRKCDLNVENLTGLVDKGLCLLVDSIHGLPVNSPEDLVKLEPEVVFVASREYHNEIVSELKKTLPDCETRSLADLLGGRHVT